MSRGRYVAFEGIEGAGKSTVASLVAERLRQSGADVVEVREPGGTVTGERIRQILLHDDEDLSPWTEALLFSASRAQLAAETIEPALARGSWVIGDRSVYSSLAYQGGGRKLGIDAVEAVNRPGLGNVWPDIVVLLRVPVATGLDRQDAPDRIGSEGSDFQSMVAEAFDLLAKLDSDRFLVIDSLRPIADLAEEIVAKLVTMPPR